MASAVKAPRRTAPAGSLLLPHRGSATTWASERTLWLADVFGAPIPPPTLRSAADNFGRSPPWRQRYRRVVVERQGVTYRSALRAGRTALQRRLSRVRDRHRPALEGALSRLRAGLDSTSVTDATPSAVDPSAVRTPRSSGSDRLRAGPRRRLTERTRVGSGCSGPLAGIGEVVREVLSETRDSSSAVADVRDHEHATRPGGVNRDTAGGSGSPSALHDPGR